MDVFFTSYSDADLGEDLNQIYMSLEGRLSAALKDRDYGPGLVSWFLMFIMVPPSSRAANDPERVLYKKKDKAIDLRLHLDYGRFAQADAAGRQALVFATARRSLELIAAKKIPDFDAARLIANVEALATAEGWARV